MEKIKISSDFECGNIEVIDCSDSKNIRLNIQKDHKSDHFQWFYFRAVNVRERNLKIKILNANEAAYPEAWSSYHAVASYDTKEWFRVPTFYDGEKLTIEHSPEFNAVYYAYFQPYLYAQHQHLIGRAQKSPLSNVRVIGQTAQGKDIDLITFGSPCMSKKRLWIVARQHPGESMASYFMEGIIDRLLDTEDKKVKQILQNATFCMVPYINPDGGMLGNLRTNANGRDLNREWGNPDPIQGPEVYHIMKEMEEKGVDLFLDIHGDEELPYVFISSIEGIPSYNEKLKNALDSFKKSWLIHSPDFQTEQGYGINAPGTANLNIASKAIGEKYKCLSMTIEMPFKDNKSNPDFIFGWSADRSKQLGSSVIDVIADVIDLL
ncbi:MAG: hypothetical protein JEZ03_07460 [Bacteroidales bacterium]|nr:hypothetical protein [Bacteroidales bacterium]